MKTRSLSILSCLAFAAVAHAQSTAFTYQGELMSGGINANGLYDLRFRLFDAASGGASVSSPQCADNVTISGGRFTSTIDFGEVSSSNPASRYLQIEVRADTGLTCGSDAGWVVLQPRQLLTSAPLALLARSAIALDAPDRNPTNAVMVDNDGRVGIGTQSPQVALQIEGNHPALAINDTAPSSSQSGYIGFWTGFANPTETAWMGFGTPGSPILSIVNARSGGHIVLNPFSGNVGIGATAPTFRLDVAGNIRCTTLTQTSSAAFKNDIEPLSLGLDALLQLEPVSYRWNDRAPEEARGKHDLGLIAEQVARVLPDAVACDSDGTPIGIDYSRITVLAVKAIQQQQALLREQQDEDAALRRRLERLEALLSVEKK